MSCWNGSFARARRSLHNRRRRSSNHRCFNLQMLNPSVTCSCSRLLSSCVLCDGPARTLDHIVGDGFLLTRVTNPCGRQTAATGGTIRRGWAQLRTPSSRCPDVLLSPLTAESRHQHAGAPTAILPACTTAAKPRTCPSSLASWLQADRKEAYNAYLGFETDDVDKPFHGRNRSAPKLGLHCSQSLLVLGARCGERLQAHRGWGPLTAAAGMLQPASPPCCQLLMPMTAGPNPESPAAGGRTRLSCPASGQRSRRTMLPWTASPTGQRLPPILRLRLPKAAPWS